MNTHKNTERAQNEMARFIIICLALVFLGGKYSNASYINRDDQDVDVDIDVNLLGNNEDLENKPLLHRDKRLWYEVGSGDCVPEGYCCEYHNFKAACCQGLSCVCKRHEFFCWCTSK